MKFTYQDIAALNPCWLTNGREAELRKRTARGVTPLMIARSRGVSVADRRWVLVRLAARLASGQKLLTLWAVGCAQDVRHLLSGETQDAADCAIQTAVAWVEGAVDEQTCRDAAASARAAAYAAAYDSARAAAYAAADAAYAAYAAADADAAAADAAAAAAAAAADAAAAAAAAADAAAARDRVATSQLVTLASMMETWPDALMGQ